jgi:D-serine deaminase-like pyridoxal phosphate-dependent protein
VLGERAFPAGGLGTRCLLADVPTPFAVIDTVRLRRNIVAMQDAVAGLGTGLRPHFKTHRTIAIAKLQWDAGAIGVTVATPAQLTLTQHELGCPVLVSSLLQVDRAAGPAIREAAGAGEVIFAIDSPPSAERLRAALGPDASAQVMIEIDPGCLRTGIDPVQAGELARAAARLGLRTIGVFSYPGHSYAPGQCGTAAEQERQALRTAAAALQRARFDAEHISAGSTPTMPFARGGVATEYRPGTYIFGDRQQLALGAIAREAIALTIVASVVAVHSDRIVVDAGGKALGRDARTWLDGFGELAEDPTATIARLYDHHAVIEPYRGPPLGVGDRVAVVPNNVNSAMVLTRSAWVSEDGVQAEEICPLADR